VPLPDIVRGALRRHAGLRFVIQVGEAEPDASLIALGKPRQVKLVKGWLKDDAFAALIQASAALLLPYQRNRYAKSISGHFAFAAAYGRPAIVPSGTWAANGSRASRRPASPTSGMRRSLTPSPLPSAAWRNCTPNPATSSSRRATGTEKR
jgi:hypothetical protein